MPFDLKDAMAKWAALEVSDKGVPSQPFIDAALAITNIFDELKGMGMVKSDIAGNAGKIQKNVTDGSKTLEEMVDGEIAAAGGDVKKGTKEGSTGLALLWLKRCELHHANPSTTTAARACATHRPFTTSRSALALITYMLEAMVADPTKKLADCVSVGYEKGLRPHHNFVMKGTFAVRHRDLAPLATAEPALARLAPLLRSCTGSLKDGTHARGLHEEAGGGRRRQRRGGDGRARADQRQVQRGCRRH